MNQENAFSSKYSTSTVNPQSLKGSPLLNQSAISLQNSSSPSNINNTSPVTNGIVLNNFNPNSLGTQTIYSPPKTVTSKKNYIAIGFILVLFILAIGIFIFIQSSARKSKK